MGLLRNTWNACKRAVCLGDPEAEQQPIHQRQQQQSQQQPIHQRQQQQSQQQPVHSARNSTEQRRAPEPQQKKQDRSKLSSRSSSRRSHDNAHYPSDPSSATTDDPQQPSPRRRQSVETRRRLRKRELHVPPHSAQLFVDDGLPYGWARVQPAQDGDVYWYNVATLETARQAPRPNPDPYTVRQGGPYHENIERCDDRAKIDMREWTAELEDAWEEMPPEARSSIVREVDTLDAADRDHPVAIWIWAMTVLVQVVDSVFNEADTIVRAMYGLARNLSMRLLQTDVEGGWTKAFGITPELDERLQGRLVFVANDIGNANTGELLENMCDSKTELGRRSLGLMRTLYELLAATPLMFPELLVHLDTVGAQVPSLDNDVHLRLTMAETLKSSKRICYIIFPAVVDRVDSRVANRPLCAINKH